MNKSKRWPSSFCCCWRANHFIDWICHFVKFQKFMNSNYVPILHSSQISISFAFLVVLTFYRQMKSFLVASKQKLLSIYVSGQFELSVYQPFRTVPPTLCTPFLMWSTIVFIFVKVVSHSSHFMQLNFNPECVSRCSRKLPFLSDVLPQGIP